MSNRIARLAYLLLVVTLASGVPSAVAQTPPSAVAAGARIYVTLGAGAAPIEGTLLALSADSVALLVNGVTRTLPLHQVTRIEQDGDANGDGALKGAIIVGLACALICGQGTPTGARFLGAVLSNAAVGAFFGWQFDRDHIGRSRLYPVKRDWRDAARKQ